MAAAQLASACDSDDFRRITSFPNLVLLLDNDAYDEGSERLLQTTLRAFSRK